jgi:peptidoglycan/xylan/chitin deacetylase (PgdA/CDA1 family)
MAERGHEIGSHSMTHPDLVAVADDMELQRELNDSRDLIAEKVLASLTTPTAIVPHSSTIGEVRALTTHSTTP